MSSVTLIAKDRGSITLIANKEETFIDGNFTFTGGVQYTPAKQDRQAMIDVIEGTSYVLTTKLVNPDGTEFDLTNATTITLGIFQRTPLQQTVSLTAGSIAGLATDGVVNFQLTATDTAFIGYAEGRVQIEVGSETHGFEGFQLVYRKNLFLT